MKKILLFILVLSCAVAKAQYNNEWIDYNKTYYKFPVVKNSLTRISYSALQSAGLQNTPAEQFQLWRNGAQIPLYTSTASGALGSSGYIEFWGEMNDGKPDINLYANINNQLSDKWSLETDTASYFLTVNNSTGNTRLVDQVNNVAGNSLPAEPYFMYTAGQYFKNKINAGYAQIVTEYIYSSVYDKGEGYTSDDIYPSSPLNDVLPDLYPYAGGPNGTFFIAACGNAVNNRTFNAKVNGTKLVDVTMDVFSDQRQLVSLPVSLLSSGSANVQVTNASVNPNDRMVVAKYEITYPRQFNFGNASNFVFELPATATGNYLRITCNYGATAPVLYDLTNLKRYTGVIDEAGIAKFALLPSAQKRKLVLMSQEASNIVYPVGFITRNFVDYTLPANQANYIIISNPLLYNGANGNPVDAYRQYRSSAAGGEAFAFTCPLIKKADGGKFGKTEKGNVWLNAERTTPYQFYQFWLNASDEDAEKWIKIFTFLAAPTIDTLIAEHKQDAGARKLQKVLAKEVTVFIHGEEEYYKAMETTEKLFSQQSTGAETLSANDLENMEGIIKFDYPREKIISGIDIISLLAESGTFPSKGEAKKMIQNGGVSINRNKVNDVAQQIGSADLLHDAYLLVQKGRRNFYLIKVQ